ncbi:3-dehydroquinate synthase [Enterococcus columbae]|uniref:3-dehydroquinate synthase n=1 Tax=Enterococcus columbae DSM 7374 = ATCC 51263 TaxID=1121865 RepID=S1N6K1_9ENTE|nr:3-dehydroquinate synthase [Enterococcus columbae]EOT44484.1 3-dehydroquinate synthase [Enterococcus columbae DSM 7374 = ATCC 51263]EOW84642.1 3-dehydroquinate synthase [Enterococcus columbae DSM 7374 = ATCC 51263]OJG23529.1 3-dehydroquinate synthase [Enterococcus columbae DSM 7374 = ATCC 51263]
MLTVQLPNHKYEIIVKRGALKHCGEWVRSLWAPQKIAIITDTMVAPLYAQQVKNLLEAENYRVEVMIVPAGEASKSLAQASQLYDQLADAEFTRSDGIIALGGGVIGDLAAFVASTYMRGIHFLQIPTTLLAQVDSSIGGKTGVNTKRAKNLVGTFAQPDGVLIDPEVLASLDLRRVREGIAEIIKSAAIADIELWHQLEQLNDEHDLLNHAELVITGALQVKRKVVEEDVLDHGSRLTLNFGHTIGHAIENTAGYGVVSHGEGVAIGMMAINQQAEKLGQTKAGTTAQLRKMIEKFNLPTSYDNWQLDALYQAITHDKKARGSKLKIILLEEIGQAKIVAIPIEEMKNYLQLEEI